MIDQNTVFERVLSTAGLELDLTLIFNLLRLQDRRSHRTLEVEQMLQSITVNSRGRCRVHWSMDLCVNTEVHDWSTDVVTRVTSLTTANNEPR